MKQGHLESALNTYEQILSHIPLDASAMIEKVRVQYLQDSISASETSIAEALDRKGYTQRTRKSLLEWQADLQYLSGDNQAASANYSALIEQSFNRATLRRLTVKRKAADSGIAGKMVVDYLNRSMKSQRREQILETLMNHPTLVPIATYLRGRVRIAERSYEMGIGDLVRAAPDLDTPSLRMESMRLAGSAAFSAGCFELSARLFEKMIKNQATDMTPGEIDGVQRWSRRALFFAKFPQTADQCSIDDITNLESNF